MALPKRRLDVKARDDLRMGEIGPVRREITFEPMPDEAPVEVPVEAEPVPA